MEVLLTGFEPFLSFKENPSQIVVQDLNGHRVKGARIEGVTLKVSYEESLQALDKLFEKKRWELVISLGLNPKIGWIAVERFAHNIKEAEEPDQKGVMAEGEEIIPGGEPLLRGHLPVRHIINTLREEGIPAAVSHSAGGYLCNTVYYYTLHKIRLWGGMGGFLHIPLHTEYLARERRHYGRGHMPLELIKKGVIRAIEVTLERVEGVEGEHSSTL